MTKSHMGTFLNTPLKSANIRYVADLKAKWLNIKMVVVTPTQI